MMQLLRSKVIGSTRKQESDSLEPPWQEWLRDETTALKQTFYAAEKENERVQHQRVEFWSPIRELPTKHLISVDKSGVNLAMVRLYALIKRIKSFRKSYKKEEKLLINQYLICPGSGGF